MHSPSAMQGVITGRHVVRHFALIWREYGRATAWRCLKAVVLRRRTTFLDVVMAPGLVPATVSARR
jgi:hypothetical protein